MKTMRPPDYHRNGNNCHNFWFMLTNVEKIQVF